MRATDPIDFFSQFEKETNQILELVSKDLQINQKKEEEWRRYPLETSYKACLAELEKAGVNFSSTKQKKHATPSPIVDAQSFAGLPTTQQIRRLTVQTITPENAIRLARTDNALAFLYLAATIPIHALAFYSKILFLTKDQIAKQLIQLEPIRNFPTDSKSTSILTQTILVNHLVTELRWIARQAIAPKENLHPADIPAVDFVLAVTATDRETKSSPIEDIHRALDDARKEEKSTLSSHPPSTDTLIRAFATYYGCSFYATILHVYASDNLNKTDLTVIQAKLPAVNSFSLITSTITPATSVTLALSV